MGEKKASALILNINTTALEKQLNAIRDLLKGDSQIAEPFDQVFASLCNNIIFCNGISTTDALGICTFSCNAKFSISFDAVTTALRANDPDLHKNLLT